MSDHILSNVQIWRQKAAEGTLSQDEMRQAIAAVRQERLGAGAKSEASKVTKVAKAAKAAPINSEDLLKELF